MKAKRSTSACSCSLQATIGTPMLSTEPRPHAPTQQKACKTSQQHPPKQLGACDRSTGGLTHGNPRSLSAHRSPTAPISMNWGPYTKEQSQKRERKDQMVDEACNFNSLGRSAQGVPQAADT
eukprot:1159381-Pelagomonas_calceolata.AAC.17